MSKVKKLVLASLLLAILIIVERLVSVQTQFLRISFAYVPVMLCAILLGPAWSAGMAALGDVIGALLFPKGAFFPGFTLSALLTGLIHGLLLYNTKNNRQFLVRLIISTFTVLVFIHIGLTSLWLVIMYKRAFIAFASTRVVANAILFPIEVGTIFLLKVFLDPAIKKFLISSRDADGEPYIPGDEDRGNGSINTDDSDF
ncbi:MAG: folate family ECF transporter S component [Spirochaetaceae bacterium]|jgi:ECF transporter S component (folate family)|nr:folate family ECF transporter S component [Spirochaetaceae bacterium]